MPSVPAAPAPPRPPPAASPGESTLTAPAFSTLSLRSRRARLRCTFTFWTTLSTNSEKSYRRGQPALFRVDA